MECLILSNFLLGLAVSLLCSFTSLSYYIDSVVVFFGGFLGTTDAGFNKILLTKKIRMHGCDYI